MFTPKIKLYTTDRNHSWLMPHIKKARSVLMRAVDVGEVTIDIETIKLTEIEVVSGRITHNWFYENLSKKAKSEGFNIVGLHLNKEYGIRQSLNGSYWLDNNDLMEFYIMTDSNWSSPGVSNLPKFYRLFLHEIAHGFIHFSGRKEELLSKLGITIDPVHYYDYTRKDIEAIFPLISFKEWSNKLYLVHLLKLVVALLTLKNLIKGENKLELWATAIKEYEGFEEPNSKNPRGSLSFRNNNPGNLRYSPYQAKTVNNFSYFNTYEEGWKALLHQLKIAVDGKSKVYHPEMTLLEFFNVYAPSLDNNNPNAYAKYVADRIGVSVDTRIKNLK